MSRPPAAAFRPALGVVPRAGDAAIARGPDATLVPRAKDAFVALVPAGAGLAPRVAAVGFAAPLRPFDVASAERLVAPADVPRPDGAAEPASRAAPSAFLFVRPTARRAVPASPPPSGRGFSRHTTSSLPIACTGAHPSVVHICSRYPRRTSRSSPCTRIFTRPWARSARSTSASTVGVRPPSPIATTGCRWWAWARRALRCTASRTGGAATGLGSGMAE